MKIIYVWTKLCSGDMFCLREGNFGERVELWREYCLEKIHARPKIIVIFYISHANLFKRIIVADVQISKRWRKGLVLHSHKSKISQFEATEGHLRSIFCEQYVYELKIGLSRQVFQVFKVMYTKNGYFFRLHTSNTFFL